MCVLMYEHVCVGECGACMCVCESMCSMYEHAHASVSIRNTCARECANMHEECPSVRVYVYEHICEHLYVCEHVGMNAY